MVKNISKIEKQKTRIEKLIQLSQQNPELRILPMVDSELGGCDFGYHSGDFGDVSIDEVYYEGERIYFRFEDEEELEEKMFNELEFNNPSWSDSYLDEQAKAEVNSLDWEKVIVVKINYPL